MRLYALFICFLLLFCTELTAQWYRSDTLGRPGEFLGPGDEIDIKVREQEEYLLYRNESPGGHTEKLFHYGLPVREKSILFLSDGKREETVVEGPEKRISLYDGPFPVREEIYLDAALQRIISYGWEGSRLMFLEASDGQELLFRQEYRRDSLGRLRTLIRYIPGNEALEDQGVRVLHYSYREGRLAETWVGDYSDGVRTRFSGLQVLEEARLSGTVLISRIEREFREGRQVERSYSADGKLVSSTTRSSDGRIIREILYSDDVQVRDREYLFQDDVLTEMVTREPQRLERRVYSYINGTLEKEEIFVNRRLVKVSLFDGNQTLEEFYRRGEVIARRRYEGDSLISEETYE